MKCGYQHLIRVIYYAAGNMNHESKVGSRHSIFVFTLSGIAVC